MNSKSIIILIVAVFIVGAGAFYGGMVFEKRSFAKQNLSRSANGNLGAGNRQGGQPGSGRAFGGGQGVNRAPNGNQGDFIAGELLSKDDKSITVKTRDGGSKIVFFSESTTIGKAVSGTAADLATGQQVMVSGKSSPEGSFSAQNIQIRTDSP